MNWLRTNWTILAALAAMSAAWGQQQVKVQNLEQAVIQQTENAREQKVIREQVIRQDEQLKAIKESQKTQEQLLRELLQSQRSIERKVSK